MSIRNQGKSSDFRGGNERPSVPANATGSNQLSRRLLLKGLLAGAGNSLFDILPGHTQTAAPGVVTAPAVSPFDLTFEIIEQFRPIELLSRRFTEVREGFGVGELSAFMRKPMQVNRRPATTQTTAAGLRITSSEDPLTIYRSDARPAAPFATAIVEVEAAQPGAKRASVAVGLFRDEQNYVACSFEAGPDAGSRTVGIDLVVDGRMTRLASAGADLAAGGQLAFVLNENIVTALTGNDGGWSPLTQFAVGDHIDFRDPGVLRSFHYGFGIGGAGRSVDVRAFRAGYFGLVGMRDLHVVSHADGTPYIRANKLYFTATQAGLAFFQAAHWGVWTLDLDDLGRIENVAQLFFARGGLVLGDHAGHLVVDEQETGFHVAVSGWGDFDFNGVNVHYLHTTRNVLEGIHVLESAVMPLPTDFSAWDPSLVRIDGSWHVGFVESPYQDRQRGFDFRPALARSTAGGQLSAFSRVGADLTRGETEGVILQKIGGKWYVLASDGDDRKYRVYDLAMQHLGYINAPYGSNIPHPQVVPVTQGGQTSYLLLTFDGTPFSPRLGYGTHGDFIVMRAAQTVPGYEFAPQ